MSKFCDDLIQSLNEAIAHAKGNGPGTPLRASAAQRLVTLRKRQMMPKK